MTEEGLLRIKGWARDGYTDKQIAKLTNKSERQFSRWKNEYPSIMTALKEGRAPVDIEIEDSLAKSARGFYVTLKKPIKLKTTKKKDGMMIEEHIEYVEEQIYYPPQTSSMIFWLKNRKPDKWRDKREQVISTKDGMLADLISGLKEPEAESPEGES